MRIVNVEKRSPLKDDLIMSSFIDLIGGAVVAYILLPLGLFGFMISAIIYMYFVIPSVVLASIRFKLIASLNSTGERMQREIGKILQTELMLKTKDRNIYKRRIELLKKSLDNLAVVYTKVDEACAVAKKMNIQTLHEVTRLMEIASKYEDTKIFSDKK